MSGPKNLGEKKQGIVYSSDETNAAYQLFPPPALTNTVILIDNDAILS
jgi:hypothetical protein